MDDTISRQDAIDVLHEYFDGMLDTDTVCPADIYGLFECIPSAQPERKHGYWIESHEHVYMCNEVKEWTNWYCSECDAPNSCPTDFCPCCGADMREVDDE